MKNKRIFKRVSISVEKPTENDINKRKKIESMGFSSFVWDEETQNKTNMADETLKPIEIFNKKLKAEVSLGGDLEFIENNVCEKKEEENPLIKFNDNNENKVDVVDEDNKEILLPKNYDLIEKKNQIILEDTNIESIILSNKLNSNEESNKNNEIVMNEECKFEDTNKFYESMILKKVCLDYKSDSIEDVQPSLQNINEIQHYLTSIKNKSNEEINEEIIKHITSDIITDSKNLFDMDNKENNSINDINTINHIEEIQNINTINDIINNYKNISEKVLEPEVKLVEDNILIVKEKMDDSENTLKNENKQEHQNNFDFITEMKEICEILNLKEEESHIKTFKVIKDSLKEQINNFNRIKIKKSLLLRTIEENEKSSTAIKNENELLKSRLFRKEDENISKDSEFINHCIERGYEIANFIKKEYQEEKNEYELEIDRIKKENISIKRKMGCAKRIVDELIKKINKEQNLNEVLNQLKKEFE